MSLRRAVVFLLATAAAFGASSAAWEMTSYQDFLKGRFTGLSLTRDGRVQLAPKIDTVFASGQPVIWSAAAAADGSVYLGTGHRGRVYRVDAAGRGELIWTAEHPEVFAVAVDASGKVYAATSPNGKVYRIEGGKAVEYFAPQGTYIWSLAFGKDGALYVGAGDLGRIYKVDSAGKGEVYYETGQSHVTALAVDAQGRLLAGTEPNGILYRITAKDKAFVLYDAALPEIRAIVPMPDGSVYAAAMGGSIARQTGATGSGAGTSASPAGSAPTVSVTVTAEAAQGGVEIKPKPEAPKPAVAAAPAPPLATALDQTGGEKSALYRIDAANLVETLWTSTEENAYDLVQSGGQMLFATDGQGRIYRLGADRKLTLLAQTDESEAMRLLPSSGGLLVATGNLGKLLRLGSAAGSEGGYESPVHDAGGAARWGRLSWRADSCAGCALRFHTRAGNSARPDATWSEWSGPLGDASGAAIPSPNARYIQWKTEFRGSGGGTSPSLDSVRLTYLTANRAPSVKSITVTAQTAAGAARTAMQASAPAYSITVTETGEISSSSLSGTPTQAVARASAEQLVITWMAEDPDADRLSYSLAFRLEGERQWIDLRSGLVDAAHTLDAEALADGKYFFRVIATDRAANSAGAAREDELVSAPILIDHTPPVVTAGAPRRTGAALEVDIDAIDAASPLRSCEYSIDAGIWHGVEATDGVTDSARERFLLRLPETPAGEHLLVIRVYDLAGNAALVRVLLR